MKDKFRNILNAKRARYGAVILLVAVLTVVIAGGLSACNVAGDPAADNPVIDDPGVDNPAANNPSGDDPVPGDEVPGDELPGKETENQISYPLYLPLPYYNTFYSEVPQSGNIDAFLHNAAVNYYSTRVTAESGHLLIPSLRLLDEWDAGDGAAYYLCFMARYDYDGLAQTLTGERLYENMGYDGSGYAIGGLIRFKVTPKDLQNGKVENYWGFEAIEILEQPPWGTNGDDIRELCGDRPICDMLLNPDSIPGDSNYDIPYIRDILPSEYAHDMPKLLKAYLECYFPDMNSDIASLWRNK